MNIQNALLWGYLLVSIVIVPGIITGLIRKVKARLQNRIGAPVWQPLLDLIKLFRKEETLSETASWLFRFSSALNLSIAVYLAITSPWISPRPDTGACDLFLFLYLFAAMRLFTMLGAMDTGSPFGPFAASREATLSFMVEPAAILSLASLALVARSSDLTVVFSNYTSQHWALWVLSGSAFLLASLVELSRMPIDDPTTHLELTMVHEAMILEASGKNLALVEFANALKLSILFGISAQCFLHAIPGLMVNASPTIHGIAGLTGLSLVAGSVGIFESLSVKLNWRAAPEFIAYSLAVALIATLAALGADFV